ncbi:capsule assembly Wzi family protein [Arcicella rigui]|uniref:Capsule assembly Wzi family protein n=1 Tax=Arcicella rigui TaxID=797020 RepID=A0ABU5QF45_9BACT|nr:capsule assembly Wzi family protein [Arcicella rigui]MEA5141162.1 capsule assembly Wzi family protein [Arcicella rigui]
MKNILLFAVFVIIFNAEYLFSQDTLKKVNAQVEAATYISTNNSMPFWLRSNQYGEIPIQSNVFSLRAQLEKEYHQNDFKNIKLSRLTYGYKIRGVINAGNSNQFILSEIYFKTKFKSAEFYIGRKREVFGITDTTLSAGTFIWSGNALPIPKVQISIPNYVPIFKNKLISIKGSFSHGVMGSADSTQNILLHQKSLYVKIGKPSWNMNVHVGINHQAQWGGKPTNPFIQKGTNQIITDYPSNLKTYWYVLSGISPIGSDKSFIVDDGGRLANHIGTIDFAVEYNEQLANILFYKQYPYDKGNISTLYKISDGVYGVSINRKQVINGIIKVNFEYLNTTNQGISSAYKLTTIVEHKRQNDYFNNVTYKDGWAYKGNIIGSPFLMPIKDSAYLLNLFNNNISKISPNYILNNRVRALTIGIESKIKTIGLRTRISLSDNLGNYTYTPIAVKQLSIQQQIVVPVKKYFVSTNIGYDNSGLLNSNLGFILMVKRSL